MAPTQSKSWLSLFLTSFTVLALSPLTTALPIGSRDSTGLSRETRGLGGGLQARSPDPRMIPSQTDALSVLFANLGMEELDELNKLHPEDEDEQGEDERKPIDDSHSSKPTVTSHHNHYETEEVTKAGGGQKHGEENKEAVPSPTPTPVKDDHSQDGNAKDTAKASDDFMNSFFEALRTKFREAINAADEVHLR